MITKITTTRTYYEMRLNKKDLITTLNEVTDSTIPADATIIVKVPGGGDWSNTDLDIDDTCPVIIRWTERVPQ